MHNFKTQFKFYFTAIPPQPKAVPSSESSGLTSGDQIAIAVVCLVVIALLIFVGVV